MRAMAVLPQMILVVPSAEYLPGYVDALERGWSPSTEDETARFDDLAKIAADSNAFLAALDDREAKGPPVRLPDGSFVPRIPGFQRWMWDGEYSGAINLAGSPQARHSLHPNHDERR